MKNLKTLGIALIAGTLIFASCKKDEQIIDPIITPSKNTGALQKFFAKNTVDATQSFVIDATTNQLITGSKGTKINFYANSFETLNGQNVTGNIKISLIEIFDKADMMLMNKPTVAVNFQPLISGGEFNITASQNGKQLRLKKWHSYNVIVPAPGGTTNDMSLFTGDETKPDTLLWKAVDSGNIRSVGGNSYSCFFDSLKWTNCDYFGSDPRPQTDVELTLPSGFKPNQCRMFLSFDNLKTVSSFYTYKNSTYFSAPNYKLPIGLELHVVAISIINGKPQVSILPTTIVSNHKQTMSNFTQVTKSQLKSLLNALP